MMTEPNGRSCMPGSDDVSADGGVFEELRQQFRIFVSDDVLFRKFVEFCNAKARQSGRLAFWQAELWNSFVAKNREAAVFADAAILEAFHVCHIHMLPLQSVEIPIQKGLWSVTRTPDIDAQINREAPFSESYCLDSSAWGNATHVTVDHCDECVAERRRIEGTGTP
ncbi:MAG: hypothetical protein JWP89_2368 [Schlesneria sp.]|nr:hypothetical protein [Schlesneria sp.]